MTDSALDDDDQRPDQVVSIPDDAQFLRAADEVCDGSDLVAPVPIYAAQRGDIVVMSNQRVGTYLGSGKMLLDSLAIDDDDRSSR